MLIFFGILLFLFLVVAHEYGHFLVAKRNGVEVEEFGIGFPPKLYGKKLGKGIFRSYYTINLLPLGGFVRLKGESSSDKRKGSFGAASLWAKTKITLAGVAANVLLAVIIFTIVGFVNMPVVVPGQFSVKSDTTKIRDDVVITHVQKGSPADKANLKLDDVIVAIAGRDILQADDVLPAVKARAGQEVKLTYKDASAGLKTREVSVKLNDSLNENSGFLGVATHDVIEERYTWSAPLTGIVFTLQLFWYTLAGLGGIIWNLLSGNVATAGESVGGPVLIVYMLSQIESITLMAFLMGTISIALAVFNILPLPALDGGRLALAAFFELVLKRPLSEKTESLVHGAGFFLLMGLAVLITFLDISRI